MDEDEILTVLIEVDDVVLLAPEAAGHLLCGHHPDVALLALYLWARFHRIFFHNYSVVRRRPF